MFRVSAESYLGDSLGYYDCESNMPEWFLQKFDIRSWERILISLQDQGFTLHRTIEGIGPSEKISKFTILRSYKAKDLIDNSKGAVERLSHDVNSVFNSIDTHLKEKG